jgi:hypothetical protein
MIFVLPLTSGVVCDGPQEWGKGGVIKMAKR